MLGYDYFYYGTIRAMVASFGYLFSNINIERKTSTGSTLIKVPLHFSNQGKAYESFSNPWSQTFPRMGFDFTVIGVDELRKTSGNTIERMKSANGVHWSRNFIPYDFSFSLYITANDIQDSLQIVEQILPHFQPSMTIKIKPLKDYPDFVTDVTVELVQVSNDFDTYGDISDHASFDWTLNFTLKGFIFAPIQTTGIGVIDTTTINMHEWGWIDSKITD